MLGLTRSKDKKQLQELFFKVDQLPAELPRDIHEMVVAWLRTLDFDSLSRALPVLATAASTWGPVAAERLESFSAAQVLQLLSVTPALGRAWATAAISRHKAGSKSSIVPAVAAALLGNRYRGILGGALRRELAAVFGQILTKGPPAQRSLAHVGAARLFVEEEDPSNLPVKPEDIDASAVFREAESGGDLAPVSIAYLFATKRLDFVSTLLQSTGQQPDSIGPALRKGIRESGDFGWSALASAVKRRPGNPELISFACLMVSGEPRETFALQAPVVDALCKVAPSLNGQSLVVVARCVGSRDDNTTIEALIGRLPSLPVNVARDLLQIPWTDWWWVAAAVIAKSGDEIEAELGRQLTDAVGLSTRAIVSLLQLARDISYGLAKEIASGRLQTPKDERHRIIDALSPPPAATRIRSMVFLLAKLRLEDSDKNRMDFESAWTDLLTNMNALDEQQCGPSEAVLILDAVTTRLVGTGVPGQLGIVTSPYSNSIVRFRGRSPQVDRRVGQICGADPTTAAKSLADGSDAEREGVLDMLLESSAPTPAIITDGLRVIIGNRNRIVRAKALALLIRLGDMTAVHDAAMLITSPKYPIPAEVAQLCREEIARVLAILAPSQLRALTNIKALSDIVLSAIVGHQYEMLLEHEVLSWALKTLADLKWEVAASIRLQLSERMELLAPQLKHVLVSGNARQKFQARQLLSLATGEQAENRRDV